MGGIPGYWCVAPKPLLRDKRVSSGALRLYLEISALCAETGHCWASNALLAELMEVSVPTVTRYVTLLEQCGYVRTEMIRNEDRTGWARRIYAGINPGQSAPQGGVVKNDQTHHEGGVIKNDETPSEGVIKIDDTPPPDDETPRGGVIKNDQTPAKMMRPHVGGSSTGSLDYNKLKEKENKKEKESLDPQTTPSVASGDSSPVMGSLGPQRCREGEPTVPPKVKNASTSDYLPDRFEAFWKYYPHDYRGNKQKARAAWNKLKPDDGTLRVLYNAMRRHMTVGRWADGIGIPNASTFLNPANGYWDMDDDGQTGPRQSDYGGMGGVVVVSDLEKL